jgi:hypothetical protein
VRELVVVVSDLYLSQETPERELPEGIALAGLQHVVRFATRSRLAGGWRPWVAEWLAENRLPTQPPSDVEAAYAPQAVAAHVPQAETAQLPPATVAAIALPHPLTLPDGTVWMATPVHLIAGMSSVHLERRSILRLSADDLVVLADEFRRVFQDSGFVLEPLTTGDFLLSGPPISTANELEPARLLGSDVAEARQSRVSEPALRRLTTEIEMWLHEHRVNDARARRGEPPVTGLWLWGGGPAPPAASVNATGATDIAFGRDAYLQGLLASIGREVFPLPPQLSAVVEDSSAQRAVLVIEIASMLQSNPNWSFFDALAHLDRLYLQPAVDALRTAKLGRLVLLANDRLLTLRALDRFKFWRRASLGLSGLQ